MSTGMQPTGARTGVSRAGMTGARGGPAKPGGGGLGKIKEMWSGLSKGVKLGILGLITIMLTGGMIFFVHQKGNAPVDLYTTKMTKEDVMACAAALTASNIDHKVAITEDGIVLNPHDRARAQALLAQNGLPHHAIQTTPDTGALGKTQAEARQSRQRLLEGEITEALRQMKGVADAYVKIAQPEEQAFADNAKPTQARVMLKLTPGTKLGEKEVASVVHLVAFSVPELDHKNVKVVDTQMQDLTALLDENEDGTIPSSKMGLMELEKAETLRKRAQDQLDQVLGPNRSKVAVNVEVDYKQRERTRRTVGGAGDNGSIVTGDVERIERFKKDPQNGGGSGDSASPVSDSGEDDGGVAQAGGGSSHAGKNDSNYENTSRTRKIDYNQDTEKTIQKAPEIKRISASVALDNVKPEVEAKLLGMVKGAMGIDEERGDVLTVTSLPFSHKMLSEGEANEMMRGMNSPDNMVATSAGVDPKVIGLALFGPAMLMLGLITVYLMKQHRVQTDRSQLLLGSPSGSTSTDIADLLNDKSGKITAVTETRANTSDALEKLAKEKPTKVAEMLKSTWLSG